MWFKHLRTKGELGNVGVIFESLLKLFPLAERVMLCDTQSESSV